MRKLAVCVTFMNEKYRRQIAGVLVRRALEAAVASAADCPGEEAAR